MVRDDAEKCEKKRQWEKSHTIGNIECEAGTPCVQVCDTGTQCVQNGDDARCVRSSEQPAFPPAENPISATSEATTPPTENTPEVEALVGKQPTENDLQKKPNTTVGAKLPEYMIVERMTGGGDMQLPDGSWATLHVGDKIPKGARIFTSYASEATIAAPNGIVLLILALSEFGIEDLNNRDAAIWKVRIKLGSGDVRFKVNQGDFRTDMQVSTPVDTGAVTGTDFAVSYNKESSIAIWEIYDHSIEVTSHITGETKTISSSYGQPIKRIEVAKNGAMTEQIAIPKDEWQARQASQTEPQSQPEENRSNGLPWVFIFLALGGIGFMLHKTGKLQPMLQRVSALVRRDNKPI
ncbi:MAG: FecR domain-containing protein [bacterium]|nr:FecR domain-containing protein [bacterium]